jgi:hypothetical protein
MIRRMNNSPDRVRAHTSPEALQEIDRRIEENIRYYASQDKETISRRIEELEREWSMERWLEMNASAIALSGLVLGLTVNKKWFMLTGAVLGFFLQHAIQGWCPPVPAFRRFGVRTRGEIDREKYALKFLRGDFEGINFGDVQSNQKQVNELLNAVYS